MSDDEPTKPVIITKMEKTPKNSVYAPPQSENFSAMSMPSRPVKSPSQDVPKGKTYEEIVGPSGSLQDILNFDFSKRLENPYK